jgi:hypothetical protein
VHCNRLAASRSRCPRRLISAEIPPGQPALGGPADSSLPESAVDRRSRSGTPKVASTASRASNRHHGNPMMESAAAASTCSAESRLRCRGGLGDLAGLPGRHTASGPPA